jgi:TRAP-type C4-dicarboxylate transport system permease small subunit
LLCFARLVHDPENLNFLKHLHKIKGNQMTQTPKTVSKSPSTLRVGLDAVYMGAAVLGAVCVALICALMVFQSLGRELGMNTGATNDIVSWLCAAAAFLTMAHAFKHGDFVRVTLVLENVSAKTRRLLELVSLFIALVAVAYLAWWACRFTYQSFEFNELAQGLLPLPIWIPQMSFALGSVLLLVAVLDEFVIVARGGVPTFVRLTAERHAKGDFSSDI